MDVHFADGVPLVLLELLASGLDRPLKSSDSSASGQIRADQDDPVGYFRAAGSRNGRRIRRVTTRCTCYKEYDPVGAHRPVLDVHLQSPRQVERRHVRLTRRT